MLAAAEEITSISPGSSYENISHNVSKTHVAPFFKERFLTCTETFLAFSWFQYQNFLSSQKFSSSYVLRMLIKLH